jgi:hypothetical protein
MWSHGNETTVYLVSWERGRKGIDFRRKTLCLQLWVRCQVASTDTFRTPNSWRSFLRSLWSLRQQSSLLFMECDGSLVSSQKNVSWNSWMQFTSSQLISLKPILILSFHLRVGLPVTLFPSGFPTKFCMHLSSSLRLITILILSP